jgi:exopolyphosphatase/guanosine-5'-triphosphate,3'-diphosphate pyrophosphatase
MVAIIDIGSNTIRLSVYDISSAGDIRQTYRQKSVAGLAGHVDKRNFLTDEGVRTACVALNRFRASVAGMNITETHVFATASLRNVLNASRVLEDIKRETGFDVIIISGEEEAICDYIGATNRSPMSDGLLIDIGGGSTELVICKGGHIDKAASVAIGALSMYSKYVSSVLPTKAQSEKIALETLKRLEVIKANALPAMCGVGGTMRALYKLNNALFGAPPDNRAVPVKNAKKILNLIATDTKLMVGRILQIAPERIHTITPGLIILNTIIKKYHCKTISVSESGVREGYLIRNILHRDIGKTGSPVTLSTSGCKGA